MKKRLLSLFVVACLIFGLIPTAAFAADQTSSDAGIRIQYVEDSYDAETGVFKVNVQAKLPSGAGIKTLKVILSFDNTKLILVKKDGTEIVATEGEKLSAGNSTTVQLKYINEDDEEASYTKQNNDLYKSGDRSALLVGLMTTQGTNQSMNKGDWFNCFQVTFKSATGNPTEKLDSDSLRIADATKDDAIVSGIFSANDSYCVMMADDSEPSKIYCFNKMSGNKASEISGNYYLMTATGTGTATYPGSTNAPSQGGEGGEPGTTSDEFELFYELNKADGTDGDKYHEYGINDTITATVKIKNNTNTAVSLQAYDIYLTYADYLIFGAFTANDGKGVAKTDVANKVTHLQAIGQNTSAADININLPANGEVTLGTITFTFNSAAEYDEELHITLTDNSVTKSEDSTNIGIADYVNGSSTTTGNKNSYYPSVARDVLGAEVNTVYTVTYDANGGSWSDNTAPTQDKQHNIVLNLDPAKTPSLAGHTFQGWSTESGEENADKKVTTYDGNEPKIFYAVWSKDTFTVTWLKQDGSALAKNENVEYGRNLSTIAPTAPDKDATDEFTFTFAGWATSANAESGTPTDKLGTVTADVTYYAAYSKTTNQYTVTFDADGGSLADGANASVTQDYNTSVTLPAVTKTGYTFDGWYEGESKAGDAGANYVIKKNVALKAKWTAATYNVTLNAMEGTIAEGKDVKSYTYGVGATLPTAADITRTGFIFGGWFTTETPGEDDQPVTAITGTETGDKTFYAHWTNDTFTITNETVAGGTVDAKNGNTYSANYNDEISITITPTAGYKYTEDSAYYYLTADKDKEDKTITPITVTVDENGIYTGTFTMPADDITVTASFAAIDYTVTVDESITNGKVTIESVAGEAVTGEEITANVGQSIVLKVEPDEGYELGSLTYTDAAGNPQTITVGEDGKGTFEMPAAATTIHATFVATEYTITLNKNSGEFIDGYEFPDKYTIASTTITLPTKDNITRTGYTFGGWFENAECTGTAVTTIDTGSTGNKAYWAKWTLTNYTITLNDNGGNYVSNYTAPTNYTYGTPVTLPTSAQITKNGYEFKGWYAASDFSGEVVTEIASTETGNKEYWAKWDIITYTITLDPDGGVISDTNWVWNEETETYTRTYNVEDDFILPTATKTNFAFKFWNLSADSEGWPAGDYNDSTNTNPTNVKGKYGNVTLVAKWQGRSDAVVEEYKYAADGYVMLRVADAGLTDGQVYQFGTGEDAITMYYMAKLEDGSNDSYMVGNSTGVYYTLIPATYAKSNVVDGKTVYTGELTDDGLEKLNAVDGTPSTIDYTKGDINGDNVTNIADANIVYQMIVNGGGYYADLDIEYRLRADMVRATADAVHRGSILDVNAIVNIINGTN